MPRTALTLILTLVASPAAACGPGFQTFLSCTFSEGRKSLEVCHDADTVTYAFGPSGAPPELSLSASVSEVDYQPWPGIGRTIWETVTFHNDGVAYVVRGALEREYPEDEAADIIVTASGGIEVRQSEATVATLVCDPGSVEFTYGEGLYDAKVAAGLCLDHATKVWGACE